MQENNAFIFSLDTNTSFKENPLISEKSIWKRIKEGDNSALGELYDIYIDDLFSFGMYHAQDRSYIMDCIHDLFLDLHKFNRNLSNTDNIKYYLFKSLKRKINKKYRVNKIVFPIDFEHSKGIEKIGKNHTKSHEEEIICFEKAFERSAMLNEAMKKLTNKQRKCLCLRFYEERSYEEISGIMGITVQTARTSVYRAIKIIRALKFNTET
jgi:RNA polymerase sigma factor (sigma-70 family)